VLTDQTPASSYITAMQRLVLLSYVTLLLVGAENVVLWWLSTYHTEKARCACLVTNGRILYHPVPRN
jgi:hypothetical protein